MNAPARRPIANPVDRYVAAWMAYRAVVRASDDELGRAGVTRGELLNLIAVYEGMIMPSCFQSDTTLAVTNLKSMMTGEADDWSDPL